jgi:hypothetical protein
MGTLPNRDEWVCFQVNLAHDPLAQSRQTARLVFRCIPGRPIAFPPRAGEKMEGCESFVVLVERAAGTSEGQRLLLVGFGFVREFCWHYKTFNASIRGHHSTVISLFSPLNFQSSVDHDSWFMKDSTGSLANEHFTLLREAAIFGLVVGASLRQSLEDDAVIMTG